MPTQVAAVLGLKEDAGKTPLESLTDYLRNKRMLLVLDNCEHLLDASTQLAVHLLGACVGLRILTTSREALGVTGEVAWAVTSFSTPDPAHLPTGMGSLVRLLVGYESVQLFVERAQAVQKGFELTRSNAATVAQVCTRLEGIPLAIELAAAQVRAMTLLQMTARLDDYLGLLKRQGRGGPPRQKTMRATLDWSYDLLCEPERVLLSRLSVFTGGWDLEAAERVCEGEGMTAGEVPDLLTGLVDKSLVVFSPGDKVVGGLFLPRLDIAWDARTTTLGIAWKFPPETTLAAEHDLLVHFGDDSFVRVRLDVTGAVSDVVQKSDYLPPGQPIVETQNEDRGRIIRLRCAVPILPSRRPVTGTPSLPLFLAWRRLSPDGAATEATAYLPLRLHQS